MVVLVAGVSGGFGSVLAETLAAKGMTVYGTMRDPGRAGASTSFPVLAMEITDDASVAACIEDGTFAREDPLSTAITVWAEVHGLVTLYRTGRFGPDATLFRQIYRQSVARMLTGLRAPLTD